MESPPVTGLQIQLWGFPRMPRLFYILYFIFYDLYCLLLIACSLFPIDAGAGDRE